MRSESELRYVAQLERGNRAFMFKGSAVDRFTKHRYTFNVVGYGHDLPSAKQRARVRAQQTYPSEKYCRVTLKERHVE